MKTKLSHLCMTLFFILGISACDKSEDIFYNKEHQNLESEVEYFTLHVIYQDENFHSQCKIVGDSTFVLDDKLKNFLIHMEKQDYSMVAHNDSTIEFYNSQDEFLTKCGITEIPKIITKAGPAAGDYACLELWDDTNYSDTYKDFHISDYYTSIDVGALKDYGLNDKVSSLKIHNKMSSSNLIAIVTVWEDSNFNHGDHDRTKHRMNFYATTSMTVNSFANLKQILCGSSGNNWNDRISSLSFHIGYSNSMPITY